jgi:PTS system nitrogen regulatory IIA component
MKMSDFLDPRAVVSDLKGTNKKEVLEELCSALVTLHPTLDRDGMVGILLDRERLGSTGVGEGVAIPHGKMADLEGIISCFGRSGRGVEFEAVDNQPVCLFFLLFAPENSAGVHLKALAKISRLLKRPSVREDLMNAASKQDMYGILTQEDAEELQVSGS